MPSRSLVRVFRRAVPVVAGVLVASVVSASVPPAALAAEAGPSVPLPPTSSTLVSQQVMAERPQDEAAKKALTGPQDPRSGKAGSGVSTASPLSPSATWAVSTHTGDFTWSYPFRVPPAPGGLVPNLALSYRSSTVDGRTSVTNNQPSWAGDGWDLSPGFVERAYGGCADDTDGDTKPPLDAGDLCWRSDNAVAAYAGGGGMLICCDTDGLWRAKSDDGSRIERRAGGPNEDNNGEFWVITTVAGTEYWFGSQSDSQATWTVPVFGDDTNEPCNRPGSFDASSCVQAWRWLLDKVVDRNGNEIRYYYKKETNSYGFNRKDTAVSYVRGGTLDRIDYGLRPGVSGPSARVLFGTLDRCVPGSACSPDKPGDWPDTDWESRCNTATCKDRYAPTFWTTQRLATVTTQVLRDATMSDVDKWELDHQFPDPGDGEKAALWLKGITHTGLVGGTQRNPAVTFEGTGLDNRLDTTEDGLSSLRRFRVSGVLSESGGITSVQYKSECRPEGPTPDKLRLQDNKLQCFPVRWNQKNHAERTDFFHKYVVAKVIQSDRLKVKDQPQSTFSEQVTSYEYLDGAGWHWDTSEFVKEDKKTWNEFRGFGRVRVRVGTANDLAGGVTMSEERFYRGMHGDRGRPETQTVKDSEGGVRTDEDWLSGYGFESATFEREGATDKPDPPRIAKTITEPVWRGPTATRAAYKAYIVGEGVQRGYTLLANNTWRTTRIETTYDNRGLPEKVDDLGDTATDADDRCTTTTYDRKPAKWLLNLPARVETVSVRCTRDAVFPANALADTTFSYDGNGNAVTMKVAKDRPAVGAAYVTAITTGYDAHGRPTSVTDALGQTSRTEYSPKLGGPLTRAVTTSPPTPATKDGLVTATDLEPAWGATKLITDPNGRTTEIAYDAAGRKTKVWLPNWTKADHPDTPSVAFSYLVRNDAPTVLTTNAVGPNGTVISSKTLYDGLLRPRQVQQPAIGGGRLITDTRYDSQGRVWKSTQPYFNESGVDDDLWVAGDTAIPGHTRAHFDGAGRQDESIYFAGANEKWRTSTRHNGEQVHVTPPAGGTASTTITNARGETVELRQYHGPKPEGTYDATKYTHSKAGLLETVTEPAGKVWRYGHDLRGLQTSAEDPDRGASTMTYDEVGRLSTVRSTGSTLAYSYDTLGRKTGTYLNEVGGTTLAEWTYDTVPGGKGQVASTTRYVDGNAYTSKVLSYDPLYKPTAQSLTIPAREGLLAATYTTAAGYNPDGSLAAESFAAAGELPEEEVNYSYHDLGPINASWGGYDGATVEHVGKTEYTSYGELARIHLGEKDKRNRGWLSFYYDTSTRRLNRSIVDVEASNPMQADANYTYDAAGTITSVADNGSSDVDIQCFRYDHLRRLTNAWTPAASTWSPAAGCSKDPAVDGLTGAAKYWHSYAYDKTGNRESETQHVAGGKDITRTYRYEVPGHAHAVSSVRTVGPGVDTRVDYTYEPTGATKTRTEAGKEQKLTWDAEGRLATSTKDGKETSFVYHTDGTRLIRRTADSTTLYLGGQELVVNHAGGNPSVARYYRHGGAVVAMRKGNGALTWLAGDHQGTAQLAINSESKQVTRRRQLPFGGQRGAQVAFPGERGFVGGTIDSSTGLVHLGAREYDPATGRFISVDPVMNPADSQQMNGYTYSNNNPITFSDPTGLYCDSCDYYARRDGTSSVWTPPPPPPPKKPVVSRTDQQVWRQEKGSKASLIRTIPASKSKPASGPMFDCQASEGALYSGVTVCDTKPNETTKQAGYALFDFCSWAKGPIGSGCDILGLSLRGINGDEIDPWDLIPFGPNNSKLDSTKLTPQACSFTGDTRVVMADGSTKAISEIKAGDKVLAADPETGEKGPRTVTDVIVHLDAVQDLMIEGGATVTTTEDHEIWNETDKQWQRADQLDRGDSLLTATGRHTRIVGLLPASKYLALAYNITVDDLHTYHVQAGDTSLLVHNRCRFEISNDGFATWVKSPDDPNAIARIQRDPDGSLNVTDVYRGNSPPGTGSDLVAAGLRAEKVQPGQRVVISGILNKETLDAHRAGQSPDTSLLGKTGAKALDKLGMRATTMEWQTVRGKLNIVITVG